MKKNQPEPIVVVRWDERHQRTEAFLAPTHDHNHDFRLYMEVFQPGAPSSDYREAGHVNTGSVSLKLLIDRFAKAHPPDVPELTSFLERQADKLRREI